MSMITTTYDETQWQLVPKVPTKAMRSAGSEAVCVSRNNFEPYEGDWDPHPDELDAIAAYRQMLGVAPPAPSVQQFVVKLPPKAQVNWEGGISAREAVNVTDSFNVALDLCRVAIEQAGGKVE